MVKKLDVSVKSYDSAGDTKWRGEAKQSKKLRVVFKMKIIDINSVLSICAAKHRALFVAFLLHNYSK